MMEFTKGHWAAALLGLLWPLCVLGHVPVVNSTTQPDAEFWPGLGVLQQSIPGVAALSKFTPEAANVLSRRDCLPNGTNYCFGNSVNYCLGCGVCCQASGRFCCAAGSVCCGGSCCAAGQTCSNGLCFAKMVTATVKRQSTITRLATRVDTVFLAVIETSIVNSVVDVTISSLAATQTEVTVVTATIMARRSVPSLMDPEPVSSKGLWALARRKLHLPELAFPRPGLARRQEPSRAAAGASTSTTTITDVEVYTTVNVIVVATTTASTTTVLSTVVRTRTRVLDAQTTVSMTSTTTLISLRPVTSASTQQAPDPVLPPLSPATTSDNQQGQTGSAAPVAPVISQNSSTPLSTPAIIGIAVGSAVFAGLVALAVYLVMVCRARRRRREAEYEDAYYGLTPDGVTYGGYSGGAAAATAMRQPRIPSLAPISSRFTPGFVARHHRTSSGFTGTTAVTSSAHGSSSAGGVVAGAKKDGKTSVVELGDTGRVEMDGEGVSRLSEIGSDNAMTPSPLSASPENRIDAASSPDSMRSPPVAPLRLSSGLPRPKQGFFYRDY
ncbi:hypothetical protein GGTG_01558 [Gaeumannomyces tritici R3-111a-1]|uniref:Mid2 domain-containing protein n=1 Tax=Gaeumannomyces tritici (strain R3-111a-1) TaxID=644352 RepID=J3NJX6_GAET3|nr:hypothetical protein GGTG_01558 [Gaeumannomyces tritici R3-111a-1]EJT81580.1 hypothetical protein GGTG_01558 [Gaeumannomyces tritici R3-111a-1]